MPADKFQDIFLPRLKEIVPNKFFPTVLESFSHTKTQTYRINNLLVSGKDVFAILEQNKIRADKVEWFDRAFIVNEGHVSPIVSKLADEGKIYKQSLSSMFVPVALDPKPYEKILDMCAAPGSKATQVADMTNDQAQLVCIDAVKNRYYKLKAVAKLLGVKNIEYILMDARRFRVKEEDMFDKILLDAPCSSEGRFDLNNKKTYEYWSLRKIKEMQKKQKGLILNAGRFLKPKGEIVYSTCTFSPEENEAVIDWFLRKNDEFEVLSVELDNIQTYPAVLQWKGRAFNSQIQKCVRILPNNIMDGFFIAKLRKRK